MGFIWTVTTATLFFIFGIKYKKYMDSRVNEKVASVKFDSGVEWSLTSDPDVNFLGLRFSEHKKD